jgi:GLPGLI family protein
MKKIIIAIAFAFLIKNSNAQIFIEKANIEFEVKANVKKNMGSSDWAERMGDKIPVFKTEVYNFTFADNKSIYKFDRLLDKDKFPEWMRSESKNVWFTDFATGKQHIEKDLIGSTFNIVDSLPALEWRLINENRNIAGFNCKKAVTKIFDSVYVFAFYTEEIMIPGGPCSINGLPGMIMGLTIPRLFTSWIATKVNVNGIDVSTIKATVAKKPYTNNELKKFVNERTNDWWNGSDATDDQKQQKNRFIWGMLL